MCKCAKCAKCANELVRSIFVQILFFYKKLTSGVTQENIQGCKDRNYYAIPPPVDNLGDNPYSIPRYQVWITNSVGERLGRLGLTNQIEPSNFKFDSIIFKTQMTNGRCFDGDI